MKRILTLGVVLASAAVVYGQGTINFSTFVVSPSVNAPVLDTTGTLAAGPRFVGQLWAGASAASLAPVGSPVAFLSGGAANGQGYIVSPTAVTVPGVAGGATAFVQLRAWDTTKGADYAAVALTGRDYGNSGTPIQITLGGAGSPPSLPANLVGLQGFSLVVPEPSTIALGLLGVAALALRRRK